MKEIKLQVKPDVLPLAKKQPGKNNDKATNAVELKDKQVKVTNKLEKLRRRRVDKMKTRDLGDERRKTMAWEDYQKLKQAELPRQLQ